MEQIYSLETYSHLANSWPWRNKNFLSRVCNRPLMAYQTWWNFCVKPHHDTALDSSYSFRQQLLFPSIKYFRYVCCTIIFMWINLCVYSADVMS